MHKGSNPMPMKSLEKKDKNNNNNNNNNNTRRDMIDTMLEVLSFLWKHGTSSLNNIMNDQTIYMYTSLRKSAAAAADCSWQRQSSRHSQEEIGHKDDGHYRWVFTWQMSVSERPDGVALLFCQASLCVAAIGGTCGSSQGSSTYSSSQKGSTCCSVSSLSWSDRSTNESNDTDT